MSKPVKNPTKAKVKAARPRAKSPSQSRPASRQATARQAASSQTMALAREGTSHCTGFNLRKAARAVSQYYDSVMRQSGLKGTQFSLLASLAALGPAPMGRLAEHMVMDRTTLSRNLKPLVGQGLIAVEPGEDRRARVLVLTADGIEALGKALPYWREAHAGMTRRMGKDGRDRLLASLADAVEAARPG